MNNAQKKLVWFGVLALAGILIVSFVPTIFHVGSYNFRKVDFVSDVKKDSAPAGASTLNGNGSHPSKPTIVDTSRPDYTAYKDIINYSRSTSQPVQKFVQALRDYKAGKRKQVRIAYLGDSFIEGDLITMDFRQMLQDTFGGGGAGFVPITSITAGFRQTIIHLFSPDWKDFNFKSSGDRSQVFISGHNFSSGSNSWVQYIAASHPHLNVFNKVYLLYKSNGVINAMINGATVSLPAAPNMGRTLVAQNVQKLSAGFPPSDKNTLYGFSFEADTGILVDNFSFRGITGIEMQYIDTTVLSQINATHPYDLIIFQYGPNLLFKPDLDNFDSYEKPMVKAVSQFRDAFPQADILMLSTGDKAFKYNGVYTTAKGVLPLLRVQQQVAAETGVNFWNFFQNMGGEGSIIKWVEGDTALANKDYTHVNARGGRKIASLLFNSLMNAYKGYK